jgi:hypothetical protein
LLIRTRDREEEIEYKLAQEQKLPHRRHAAGETSKLGLFTEEEASAAAVLPFATDEYGGRFERDEARYYDRFGGVYDIHGYQSADGSYRTAAGDHYDAETHTVRYAAGGSEALPTDLTGFGAELLRLAIQIAEIREDMRAGQAAGRSPATVQAEQAAALAVATIAGAATAAKGQQTKAGFAASRVAAAAENDTAYEAACCARDEAEKAKFEKAVMNGDFRADAAAAEGGANKHLSCCHVDHRDVRKAASFMKDNIAAGRVPHRMTRYQYQDVLRMADDIEQLVSCTLNQPIQVVLPGLSAEANEAFAAAKGDTKGLCRKLMVDFAAFAKRNKISSEEAAAGIVAALKKPANLLRRAGMGMA